MFETELLRHTDHVWTGKHESERDFSCQNIIDWRYKAELYHVSIIGHNKLIGNIGSTSHYSASLIVHELYLIAEPTNKIPQHDIEITSNIIHLNELIQAVY